MRREIVISIVLHLAAVMLLLAATPFGQTPDRLLGEIIRVDLVAGMDEFTAVAEPEPEIIESDPTPSRIIPQPIDDEPVEIPISDPTTIDDPVEVEPEEKPPEPEPESQPPSNSERTQPEEQSAEIHSPVTAGSSPFAGARIDNASFQYPYWFTQAFNKILRQWRNPVSSNASLVCVIYFQVIKSGRILEANIESSSGIDTFDDACLRAVTSSAPFPPLPRQFGEEIIGLSLPFQYEPPR